jgi:hypothetical protein
MSAGEIAWPELAVQKDAEPSLSEVLIGSDSVRYSLLLLYDERRTVRQ